MPRSSLTVLVLICLPFTLCSQEPTSAEIEWIKQNAIVFETPEAGHGFEDLAPLKELIGDARIVALGESTHGTREIFQMKHRLVEFLASEMGFTIFSIEANMPEAYRVNDFVLHGKGDPKKLLKGMYFWTWDTQEVLDMILWMREFNESGKGRIEFTGFDMQTPTVAAANVQEYVEKVDPGYSDTVAGAYSDVDKLRARMRKQARFGVATASFPVEAAAGKQLRFSGYVKTQEISDGFAGLWWRADSDGRSVAFNNMQAIGPKGTTDWKRYSLELSIPADIDNINFGVLHPGDGTAWFDSLEVELDGEPYVNGELFDFDFESETLKGFPYGGGQGYEVELDTQVVQSGKQSLRIEHVGGPETDKEEAPDFDPADVIQACMDVLQHLEASRESYTKKSSAKDYEWAVQNARVVLQSGRVQNRDKAMAENVTWILDHAPADAKIILWAHNSHVLKKHPMMGAHLDTRYGDEMVVLGFACNRGKYTAVVKDEGIPENDLQPSAPGSVEYYLHQTGLPRFVLDLRKASPDSAASAWLTKTLKFRVIGALATEKQFHPLNAGEVFDAFIYFENTTATEVLRPREW